jgi:D-3-phosphoglycerate dehydrogenase / 2-oxoglutarate reductase
MSTYRVVVTDQVFPTVDLERELLAGIDAELIVAEDDRDEMLRLASSADALLNTYAPFSSEDLQTLGACQIIARYGIGVDNIDLDAARQAGIAVTNVPDYCLEEVAVHTVALILTSQRRIPEGDMLVRSGGWGVAELRPMRRISELTVGLLGYGRIARNVSSIMASMGATVIAHDPFVTDPGDDTRMVAMEQLLAESDILSLHAPLTPETRGVIGTRELEQMRHDAVLVNTSRGPLIVLDDLLTALKLRTIGAAALDVVDPEPLPDPSLVAGVPNLLLTPHVAYYSESALRESQTKATTQVINRLTGKPLDYQVNA